jgi:hypothetical protein
MKLIKGFFFLALAASVVSSSFAAAETALPLIRVPKTEEAMQATKATTARDAANSPVKPVTRQTKSKQVKPSAHKTTAKQTKGTSPKKHNTKAPRQAHTAK